jgi:hypothetical protein
MLLRAHENAYSEDVSHTCFEARPGPSIVPTSAFSVELSQARGHDFVSYDDLWANLNYLANKEWRQYIAFILVAL